jgi:hypothetical protein
MAPDSAPTWSRPIERAQAREKLVSLEGGRSEHFGESAVAQAAQKLELPKTVLGMDEPEAEQRVAFISGAHMRHAVAVANDFEPSA